jgi:hypothetical protein
MADLTADVLVVRPIYGICNRQGKQLFADVSGTSFRIELLFVIDNARWYAWISTYHHPQGKSRHTQEQYHGW